MSVLDLCSSEFPGRRRQGTAERVFGTANFFADFGGGDEKRGRLFKYRKNIKYTRKFSYMHYIHMKTWINHAI